MSKDDRGRIVPLQFIADRRVLGGIPGGGEVAIGRDDPRSRKHALPRHATVLALQGPGDARLPLATRRKAYVRSEEHTSELQSQSNLVCRLLLEKKKKRKLRSDITASDQYILVK